MEQPCEAAFLSELAPDMAASGVSPPDVTVLVVYVLPLMSFPYLDQSARPAYLRRMREVYAGLPSVKVEPLLFAPHEISGERLQTMMRVGDSTRKVYR